MVPHYIPFTSSTDRRTSPERSEASGLTWRTLGVDSLSGYQLSGAGGLDKWATRVSQGTWSEESPAPEPLRNLTMGTTGLDQREPVVQIGACGIVGPYSKHLSTSITIGVCSTWSDQLVIFLQRLLQSTREARWPCPPPTPYQRLLVPGHRPAPSSPLSRRGLALGQRRESKVRLDDSEVGEELLGLGVVDAGSDNHIITRDPIDGGGDLVLIASLKGVDHSKHLGSVAASRGGIGQNQSNGLLGVDDEYGSNGQGHALLVHVGGILMVDPVRLISRCLFSRHPIAYIS
jgi:hypothetical protein